MATVEGADRVAAALQRRAAAYGPLARLTVGYSAEYAIYVHEDLTARHPTGQAKFLEAPARQLAGDLARVVRQALLAGKPMLEALAEAGRMLLEASRALVPVDTGRLRDSGYVSVE